MKIALVTSNLRGGGAEKVFLRIASLLSAREHEVHVILLEHLVDHAVDPALTVHGLTAPGQPCRKGFIGKRVAAWRLRRLVRRLERDGAFDLIISTPPFADEVAALAGLPRLWHRIANTLSAELRRLPAEKARRRRERYRRLYDGAKLVAVSDGVARDLREGLGLDRTQIVRIYNPLDVDALRELAQAPQPEIPDRPYVIHVGRFAGQKRHDLLLDAWQRVRADMILVLLTQPEPALQAMIAERGLNDRVLIAGFQPNPYPWIARAQLLVLSSDHEGMPNVILEAAALHTPVVSTDCPSGPREILGGACPECLVPMNDATALAEAIESALQRRPAIENVDLSAFHAASVAQAYERLATAGDGGMV